LSSLTRLELCTIKLRKKECYCGKQKKAVHVDITNVHNDIPITQLNGTESKIVYCDTKCQLCHHEAVFSCLITEPNDRPHNS
jgi:hypothetical protein